ncbi:hypothetical protein LGK97_08265 [Clostridium sp. CS001]|uniref:hypothetical protein n=1 Tax=Clostridium sp. CS001 TaxID=2880648 RepID=UPI001CF543CE|nr:hypothetical protein [Clostridium sp. CS001]MCB2289758.1 hypothetical protein [Clostridium sp. CS001]
MIKKVFILVMLVLLFKNNLACANTVNAKYNYNAIEIPVTDIDDITSWANRKGFEIVHFLQVLAQPIIIIIFIISAILLLLGTLGNPYLTGKGFMGLIMSIFIYALILYASLIIQSFAGWVQH